MKILIADDSPVQRSILGNVLRDAGYEVEVACTGGEAFQRMMNSVDPPSICLLDWWMPALSGLDLARMMRARVGSPYTYLILVTANTEATSLQEAFSAGIDDFVRKPFDPAEILARVRAGERVVMLETQLRSTVDTLKFQAEHDSLTCLLNRGAVMNGLNQEIIRAVRTKAPLSVMLSDVDHFKRINDTYGHPFGDRVLQLVAKTIQDSIRPYDIAGRYGGEEFLIVLPSCEAEVASERAEAIRECMTRRIKDELGVEVTLSAGITCTSALADPDVTGVLQLTDTALYSAKRGGRDRVEIYHSLPVPAESTVSIQ